MDWEDFYEVIILELRYNWWKRDSIRRNFKWKGFKIGVFKVYKKVYLIRVKYVSKRVV